MRVLKFHTGRGGRFHNAGFVKFVGFERIDEGTAYESLYFDENGDLSDDNHSIDVEINEDGTGFINQDNDYDTTRCLFENDLDHKQIEALKREAKGGFDDKEARKILEMHYPEHLED